VAPVRHIRPSNGRPDSERHVAAARQKLLAKAAVTEMTEYLADKELQTSPARSTNSYKLTI
jgi:hypothetical protein